MPCNTHPDAGSYAYGKCKECVRIRNRRACKVYKQKQKNLTGVERLLDGLGKAGKPSDVVEYQLNLPF